jgi:hypothetical protein
MEKPEISLKSIFGRPPEEAVRFLRAKGYKIGFDYRDVWQQEQQNMFTVAKVMELDLLAEIRAGVDQALAQGTTLAEFAKNLRPELVKRGWWGKKNMTDPETGEEKMVQLGSPRRLKIIYDTNLRTAHAEGQWERIQATKGALPYLMYDHTPSKYERKEHAAWDGLVLPADDDWWLAHMPVRAWGCKCRVVQMTQRQVERQGLSVGSAPPEHYYNYVNKRTGDAQRIPAGVDPSFNYPPGKRTVALEKMLAEKTAAAQIASNAAAAPTTLDDFVAAGRAITDTLPAAPAELLAALHARLAKEVGTGTACAVASRGKGAALVQQASRHYPTSWVQAADEIGPTYARLEPPSGRGWHASLEKGTAARLPGFGSVMTFDKPASYLAVRDIDNAVHEYAHRLQAAFPALQAKFAEFHQRRTQGDELESLQKLVPKANYRANEMTRKDNYVDPYYGKEYDGDPREAMTMAMQSVLHGGIGAWRLRALYNGDREMLDFVVGLLFKWTP